MSSPPCFNASNAVAAVSVASPSRKLNSSAAGIENPSASAARIVTRLRLVPGHNASICATPMTTAARTVMSSRDNVPAGRCRK